MEFYDKSVDFSLNRLKTDKLKGLSSSVARSRLGNFGENKLSVKKKESIISKIFNILKEPMLIILLFAFFIALGTALGEAFKTGKGDFSECLGVLGAIFLSVLITLIMEGSSERAFAMLNKIYDNSPVKVIRDGTVVLVGSSFVTVGDVILIESGDKIVCDGRLIESNALTVDESALTGESVPSEKEANIVLKMGTPLAERKNCVYSGTFVTGGNAKIVVTGVGDDTEIGRIAGGLKEKNATTSPLNQKLAKLGKIITIIGVCTSVLVFALSVFRLVMEGNVNFNGIKELFISAVILIVAAVPEGLPTIVAVSLALNMIKLAKENALIRKMVAGETAGAVSVICSDKTGTLTQNKMKVESVCTGKYCFAPDRDFSEFLLENFICKSTAKVTEEKGKRSYFGNGTECALLECVVKRGKGRELDTYKQKYKMVGREPFSSEKKYMITSVEVNGTTRKLLKGAPEKVIALCKMKEEQKRELFLEIEAKQKKARRIICFAHADGEEEYLFDGFVSIVDPVRPEVQEAIEKCKSAGIKVKMLTGDNYVTATAVAEELKIVKGKGEVVSAIDIENLSDEDFKRALSKITVIARSTPAVKLRVVRALKEMGEVVAVTGDGINDAPAIKHADVGIAMGKSGSEITKEASDIVLLDDSFSTVVKAVAFGRNVYKNLQRFILFQLSVNLSALLFITVTAILGLNTPFNTFELLWINVIMDGPPALTLGMEKAGKNIMRGNPVKRTDSIVSKKMLVRIIFNGVFIGSVMIAQYITNFLKVSASERSSAVFTLFICFQLFNAFNSRELGAESIFKSMGKNKIMALTFLAVFLLHFIFVQALPWVFSVNPMSALSWIKILLTASSVVIFSEVAKLAYRPVKKLFGYK